MRVFRYLPDYIQSQMEKEKFTTEKARKIMIDYLREHPFIFADAFWCFGWRENEYEAILMVQLRADICKIFKRNKELRDWRCKSQAIRPCEGRECIYRWCCRRAKQESIYIPSWFETL